MCETRTFTIHYTEQAADEVDTATAVGGLVDDMTEYVDAIFARLAHEVKEIFPSVVASVEVE